MYTKLVPSTATSVGYARQSNPPAKSAGTIAMTIWARITNALRRKPVRQTDMERIWEWLTCAKCHVRMTMTEERMPYSNPLHSRETFRVAEVLTCPECGATKKRTLTIGH